MLLLIAQGVTLYAIFRVFRPVLRRIIVKTDIDNIPGPASPSFLRGPWHPVFIFLLHNDSAASVGSWPQLFDANGWNFHKELRERCTSSVLYRFIAISKSSLV